MPARKIFVVVHGIGEQIRSQTVQSVATRFARTLDPAGDRLVSPLPLGWFHKVVAARILEEGRQGEALDRLRFSEVYWAGIPKGVKEGKDTLQETKAWGRSIIARAKYLYLKTHGTAGGGQIPDRPSFSLAADALEELINTLWTLNYLSWIGERLGLFSFDLKEVLDSYVGDVQLVAEFKDYRREIVGVFHDHMAKCAVMEDDEESAPEIYIIAHSEGAVISFLAIIAALSGISPEQEKRGNGDSRENGGEIFPWVRQIRGLMTIGAPIDKHILLWPGIWRRFDDPDKEFEPVVGAPGLEKKIEWRNYYDLADPVGFDLDTTRQWITDQKFHEFFSFNGSDDGGAGSRNRAGSFRRWLQQEWYRRLCQLSEKAGLCKSAAPVENHDHGFCRYWFPGKAHTDYWGDNAVFSHFYEEVVQGKTGTPPPRSRFWVSLISGRIPYVISWLFLFAGVWLFCSRSVSFIFPEVDATRQYILWMSIGSLPEARIKDGELVLRVLSLSCLMFGTMALAKVPTLTYQSPWKGFLWFAALLVPFGALEYWIWRTSRESPGFMLVVAGIACVLGWLSAFLVRWGQGVSRHGKENLLTNIRKLDSELSGLNDLQAAFDKERMGGKSELLLREMPEYQRLETANVERKRIAVARDKCSRRLEKHLRGKHVRSFRKRARPLMLFVGLLLPVLVSLAYAGRPDFEEECRAKFADKKIKWESDRKMKCLAEEETDHLREEADREFNESILKIIQISPPFWPVLLAYVTFMLLFRLSASTFGLAYMWGSYVRDSKVNRTLLDWYRSGNSSTVPKENDS